MIADSHAVRDRYPLLCEKAYLKWSDSPSVLVDELEGILSKKAPSDKCGRNPFVQEDPTLADVADIFFDQLEYPHDRDRLHRVFSDYPELRNQDVPARELMKVLPHDLQRILGSSLDQYRIRTDAMWSKVRGELPSDGSLEIVSVIATREAEFDIRLRNLSDSAAYITRITVRVLKDWGVMAPTLNPTAKYDLPVGSLSVGESTSIDVSHIIEPHGADRFLIALHTTRVL
jgi:hypothetical protein